VADGHASAFSSRGLIAVTLKGDPASAITRFADSSAMEWFGLPRVLD